MKEIDPAILRKSVYGQPLTQSERRKLQRHRKRDRQEFLGWVIFASVLTLPVLGYVLRTCVWPG